MSSIHVTKVSSKHSCDKYSSPVTSNISLDGSDISMRTNDVNINGNTYVNTPSPSSTASTSTNEHSIKYSSSRSKINIHTSMSFKRRHRNDKLFHYAHSLNRQYIVTMTSILFQMQKEIYKLKRRTQHVEQMLAKQMSIPHPVIRIPRLTPDEITKICVKNNEKEQNISSQIAEENTHHNQSLSPPVIVNIESLSDEHDKNDNGTPTTTHDDIATPVTNQTENEINIEEQPIKSKANKYCTICDKDFSHRSAFLRHMRRIHKNMYPSESTNDTLPEVDHFASTTPASTIDHADNENENESCRVVVNPWDIGEIRLRPRPMSKTVNTPVPKVKCNTCSKFFRADYIKKHQRRTHQARKLSTSSQVTDTTNGKDSTGFTITDDNQTVVEQLPATNINSPSAITIAEMDIDDMPIQFRKESSKSIIIAVTCLERYQLDIIEEFLEKFSSRVSQTAAVDSRTTHLIANDTQRELRSPLSIKLIEGIAHHCFCVSYRWILDCIKYDRIVDETNFEIEGDDTDYHPLGGPKRSRLTENRHALFENICFMIKCNENNDINMTNERLQDLIQTCGGRIITCVTQSFLNQYEIVVLCDRLYVSERRHNYDQCKGLGINFVSSDWVLESVLEYRRKPYKFYEERPL